MIKVWRKDILRTHKWSIDIKARLQIEPVFVDWYYPVACCLEVSVLGTRKRWIRRLRMRVCHVPRDMCTCMCRPTMHVHICLLLGHKYSLVQYLYLRITFSRVICMFAWFGCDIINHQQTRKHTIIVFGQVQTVYPGRSGRIFLALNFLSIQSDIKRATFTRGM